MLLKIDAMLFMNLFQFANKNDGLGNIMVTITNHSSKVFAMIYLIGIGILLVKRKKVVLPFIIAPATAFITVHIIRFLYERPRPFVAMDIDSLIYHAPDGSLPSMHAVSAFVIAVAIWHVNKNVGRWVLILAGITGLSRVMVGVHYPLDVLLGALLAIGIGHITFKTVHW
ncbi:phosphatase PAP2 family protein [Tindallia californiensis]|uniref:Undecaprenyl-diphosphatase n=1 Tax=Tindallia californiensis TaxID=159292 RepID=A0A1H3Q694_9FIRM|nr:phosphatase PAP2 family protein [Tindallia californiensis]SDZ08780.1 Undecaprenyl-diphosphatase [Tindallia californiensis]